MEGDNWWDFVQNTMYIAWTILDKSTEQYLHKFMFNKPPNIPLYRVLHTLALEYLAVMSKD